MIQTQKLSAITSIIFFQNFSLLKESQKKKSMQISFRNRDTANFISGYCPELQNNTHFLDEEDKTINFLMQRSR